MSTSISFIFASICLIISIMQFKKKGFLFNNAYIFANKQERENMEKDIHYRQSGIVFALCATLFLLIGIESIAKTGYIWIAETILVVMVIVYAMASSIKEAKR